MYMHIISVVGAREQCSLPGASRPAGGRLPPRQPGHQAPATGQDYRTNQLLWVGLPQTIVPAIISKVLVTHFHM